MAFEFANQFEIDGRPVGAGCPVYIIAEAGVAHFGSLKKAYDLVDLAVEAGADAVKFQVFQARKLISSASREWIDRLSSRELPYDSFVKIAQYCREKCITFFATAHDEPSLDFLDSLETPVYKIGSGEVENWPFIRKVAQKGKPVILSTGMYTEEQMQEAVDIFAKAGNPQLAVLHCVTAYPTAPRLINLRAIKAIQDMGVIAGYSDHTMGYHIPLAAVAMGAAVIEKHITLDYDVPNAQDWKVSCGPDDLHLFVEQVREVEESLGSGAKSPNKAEKQSLAWARKSIVSACAISAGQCITEDMLVCKRPGTGISPAEFEKVLGREAAVDIREDELITWEQLR
ncbi:N-acetylneuraminate synthase [Desulfatibacillum alkenivorans DSM 16219]|jgi:N-acetylneuraminate synthase/N,N'-diacetyllegionaminate synthase|uniref:N-acetylneuraminate synthase n=1 Tax=Desulfatibacillum alkenivorans DSM 16219 TaxID=1121393 RepID=A0A1M6RY46_9BACT|nr:N-acetylneuraminate synthase family protein [Desulfatibacillum alkenivorans]SHK37340.1 N-acetylneuraminate synthase [Desulfatibacillum alkenivorans DSM 16219]